MYLQKRKTGKRADVSVKTFLKIKSGVGTTNGLEGDNKCSSAAIKTFCGDNDIILDM